MTASRESCEVGAMTTAISLARRYDLSLILLKPGEKASVGRWKEAEATPEEIMEHIERELRGSGGDE